MKKSFLLLTLMLCAGFVLAQAPPLPPPPSGGGGSVAAPLDGFSWLLLLFGGLFGGKQFFDNREGDE